MGDSVASGGKSSDVAMPCEPSHIPQVANLKRVFELWGLDRAFHDAYLADPEGTLAGTGLDVDPRAVSLILLRRLPEGTVDWDNPDELPETFVWYRDYVEGRFQRNAAARVRDLPEDPRFRDWVLRQLHRCEREVGRRARFMQHMPVVFELSSGCSVGCPFCALAAGRLKGIFRHTEENAALWRDVLARMHAIVGDAAGRGTCYYATEPLDNRDYELFLRDYHEEFGRVPQTTTAAATRDLDRTRELLRWGQGTHPHFDRISVLGKRDFDVLIDAFTPEELIFTDLLPQFEEAPICELTKAGRNLDANHGRDGTIACASGFVVNMAEKSVRLLTPTNASEEHPTGELVYERATFSDGDSLEEAVRGMMDRHMHETISLTSIFRC